MSNTSSLLTTTQAAQLLGCCQKTIYNRIKQGKLKAHSIGTAYRIRREDLATFARVSK